MQRELRQGLPLLDVGRNVTVRENQSDYGLWGSHSVDVDQLVSLLANKLAYITPSKGRLQLCNALTIDNSKMKDEPKTGLADKLQLATIRIILTFSHRSPTVFVSHVSELVNLWAVAERPET